MSGLIPAFLTYLPVAALIGLGIEIANTHYVGHTKADLQDYQQAKMFLHWVTNNKPAITWLTLSYLAGLLALRRWLTSLLESKVYLRKTSLVSRFSFRDNKSDPIKLASFYVSILIMFISALALLMQ